MPIVPAAILFDLPFGGKPQIRPTADCGYKAAQGATDGAVGEGNIGAGAGATVGKMGMNRSMKAGVGSASITLPNGLVVAAIVAVNAVGDIVDPATGKTVAGVRTEDGKSLADVRTLLRSGALMRRPAPRAGENTTIGLVATNAKMTKVDIHRVAMMADDGFARAITPSHTVGDGDTVFALATGRWDGEANPTIVGALAAEAMAEAIVRAAAKAESSNGVPVGARARHRAATTQVSEASGRQRRPDASIGARSSAGRSVLGAAMLAPAIVRAQASKPAMPYGVGAGDVSGGRAIIWSRTDRPARLVVEYATTESFRDPRRVIGPAALEPIGLHRARRAPRAAGGAAHLLSRALPGSGRPARLERSGGGQLRDARRPTRRATSRIAWSADTVGQGWGINPSGAACACTTRCAARSPMCSSTAATPSTPTRRSLPEVKLDDGTIWKNVVTEAKSNPAETLADFRGYHQYNLLDEHMRRFNAEVAQMPIWDDHEVRDNWYPTRDLSKDDRYQLKSMALIAERARQAFLEHHPIAIDPDNQDRIHRTVSLGPAVEVFALDMRSFRGPNSENRQPALDDSSALLGATQLAWLKERLAASRATWKVIASDLPIGVVVPDRPSFYRGGRQRRPGRAARARARDRRSAALHQGATRSATWCGSRRTFTTAPRITTIRRERSSPTSIRSGSSSPGRCTPGRSARTRSIRRSARRRSSSASRRA